MEDSTDLEEDLAAVLDTLDDRFTARGWEPLDSAARRNAIKALEPYWIHARDIAHCLAVKAGSTSEQTLSRTSLLPALERPDDTSVGYQVDTRLSRIRQREYGRSRAGSPGMEIAAPSAALVTSRDPKAVDTTSQDAENKTRADEDITELLPGTTGHSQRSVGAVYAATRSNTVSQSVYAVLCLSNLPFYLQRAMTRKRCRDDSNNDEDPSCPKEKPSNAPRRESKRRRVIRQR